MGTMVFPWVFNGSPVKNPGDLMSRLSGGRLIVPSGQGQIADFALFPMLFEGFQLIVTLLFVASLTLPQTTTHAWKRYWEPSFYQGFSMVRPGKTRESQVASIGSVVNRYFRARAGSWFSFVFTRFLKDFS